MDPVKDDIQEMDPISYERIIDAKIDPKTLKAHSIPMGRDWKIVL